MMKDKIQGNLKEMKGKLKQTWSKLTDDDVQRFEGNWDEFSGHLQKRYGSTKEKVWQEIEAFKKSLLGKTDKN